MSGEYKIPYREGYPLGQRRRRARRAVVATLLGALLQSCVAQRHEPYAGHDAGDGRRVVAALDSLADRRPFAPTVEPLPSPDGRLRVWAIEASSVTVNNQPGGSVQATYFESLAPGPRPLVVVLPIWGSSVFPPRTVVRRLIRPGHGRDVHVLWLHGPDKLIDWEAAYRAASPDELERAMAGWVASILGTAVDVRRLVDWTRQRSEVARGRVAVVGFSIGAIVGAITAGIDPHVETGVFVAGGADLHHIVAHCRGRSAELRRIVRERFGWDASEFAAWLEPRLEPANPARYVAGVDPRRILIVEASKDVCIPAPARDTFWRALGRPERLWLPYGHRVSFLSMTALGLHRTRREILRFLDRELLASSTSPAGDVDEGRATTGR